MKTTRKKLLSVLKKVGGKSAAELIKSLPEPEVTINSDGTTTHTYKMKASLPYSDKDRKEAYDSVVAKLDALNAGTILIDPSKTIGGDGFKNLSADLSKREGE